MTAHLADGRAWLGCLQPDSRMGRGRRGTSGPGLTSHCPDCASPPLFTLRNRIAHLHVGKHASVHRSREVDGGVNTRVALTPREAQVYRVITDPHVIQTQRQRHMAQTHNRHTPECTLTHAHHTQPRYSETRGTHTYDHTQAY